MPVSPAVATTAAPRPLRVAPSAPDPAVTIRRALPGDAAAVRRLAELDSRRAPRGTVLLAEVGPELLAAVSLDDGHTVADPFRPTADLVALLAARGGQLRRSDTGHPAPAGRRRRARLGTPARART
jgi:hypothetical protein